MLDLALCSPRIIAFVTETVPIRHILRPIEEPDLQPIIVPARGPPIFDLEFDQTPDYDLSTMEPDYELAQRVNWL